MTKWYIDTIQEIIKFVKNDIQDDYHKTIKFDKIAWRTGGFDKDSNLWVHWTCPNCNNQNVTVHSFYYQMKYKTIRKVTCSFGCKWKFIIKDNPEN